MRNAGYTALKAIIAMGVMVVIFLLITSMAFKRAMIRPDGTRVVLPAERLSPFAMTRAWRDLETIVGFGPRYPGSPGMKSLRNYLRNELAVAGFEVKEHPFTPTTSLGEIPMRNIWVTIPGDRPGKLILCTHYDTKRITGFTFVGANSGGSGTAWLLEMARALGSAPRPGVTLELVWLDGGEGLAEGDSGGYGARVLADTLQGETVEVIYLDMVGDCRLRIHQDADAPKALRNALWNAAERLRYRRQFGIPGPTGPGAHVVLRAAGIPAIGLVDFSYGGTAVQHKKNYHTARDTMERVCAESLRAVADVIYHALPTIGEDLQKLSSVKG